MDQTPTQPIVNIRDGLWGNLAMIAFCLGLGAFAVSMDYKFHGEVSVFVWAFAAFFVLFCFLPISAIRKPKSRLLAIDGCHLLWRIYDQKRAQATLEGRLPLHSIRALNWVFPEHSRWSDSDAPARPDLVFITAERRRHTLPSEFFPGAYRRKIEAVLKDKIPGLRIVEKHKTRRGVRRERGRAVRP